MDSSTLGLSEQPFRTAGDPAALVPYEGHLAALDFLRETYGHEHGLGLFQGPALSGKTTIIREFTKTLPEDIAHAIVDGAGHQTDALLQRILSQFGYDIELSSANERINMLKVFVLQQTAASHVPLLIIENTHAMMPSALRTLCDLAALKVQQKSALRLILASDRSMTAMVQAPAMAGIAKRLTGILDLEPMSDFETKNYLYAKMRAGGCGTPATVFPDDVCIELHTASNGWPGVVDRLALFALSKVEKLPITPELIERPTTAADLSELLDRKCNWSMDDDVVPPRLLVTFGGETLHELTMSKPRLLLGRSEHNDLQISSRFISRHHALFVRHGSSTFLMDLNSTNGTFVNSRRISNLMMKHDDIVQLGNHRIKFIDPTAVERTPLDDTGFNETLVMKNLDDIRRVLAYENTRLVDVPPQKAPAAAER